MNDLARSIRMVCRFNPNDGLYSAVSEDIRATYAPQLAAPKTPKIERSLPHILEEQHTCCGCFTNLTRGVFVKCGISWLLFCNKCSQSPAMLSPQQTYVLWAGASLQVVLLILLGWWLK